MSEPALKLYEQQGAQPGDLDVADLERRRSALIRENMSELSTDHDLQVELGLLTAMIRRARKSEHFAS